MRLFAAIELPPALLDAVADYVDSVRSALPDAPVRWRRPDQLHLTLVFLGSVPGERLTDITGALDAMAEHTPPLRLGIEGSGRFRTVVWLGVTGDTQELAGLVDRLRTALQLDEARPFHPHVTIGRLRDERRSRHLQLPPAGPLGAFETTQATLFQSETLPEGARYTLLHRSRFRTA